MKQNYFTVHKNKKPKKAKYSNPYTKKQRESIEKLTLDFTKAVERIRLIHGAMASVNKNCPQKTIDVLNQIVDKVYDMDSPSETES